MANKTSSVKLLGEVHTPIWSGDRLSRMYPRFSDIGIVGESHETSDNAVVYGQGCLFSEYLQRNGLDTPALVKLIDAASPLSVQVHPSPGDADILGGISKEEIWYVLDAEDGASILYGTRDDVTISAIRDAIHDGDIVHLLKRIPVKAGDVFMIPCGMIHSLGGGITVLEVQNRAGTTYRVQDISGSRETHRDESARSIRIYSGDEAAGCAFASGTTNRVRSLPGKVIADTEGFALSVCKTADEGIDVVSHYDGTYIFCHEGSGTVGDLSFSAGESVYIPLSGQAVSLSPKSVVFFVI